MVRAEEEMFGARTEGEGGLNWKCLGAWTERADGLRGRGLVVRAEEEMFGARTEGDGGLNWKCLGAWTERADGLKDRRLRVRTEGELNRFGGSD